jgi:hypothetical protein
MKRQSVDTSACGPFLTRATLQQQQKEAVALFLCVKGLTSSCDTIQDYIFIIYKYL